MAEAVSILGVISASVHLTEKIVELSSRVKNAPKEALELLSEVMSIGHSIRSLRTHLQREEARGNNAFAQTSVLFFAINGCHGQLEALHKTLDAVSSASGFARFWHRLEWPFERRDALDAVKSLHRYAQIFHFAVSMDAISTVSLSQRDMLIEIQASLDAMNGQQGSLSAVRSYISEVRDAVAQLPLVAAAARETSETLVKMKQDDALSKILNLLPPLPYRERHRELQLRRMDGAGQWVLSRPEFLLWRNSDGSSQHDNTIWCNGQPGAGKTYLASVIIDYLESCSTQDHAKIISFYFDYKQHVEQTPFKIAQTLLHQLLSTYEAVPSSIQELQRRITTTQYVPNWNDLKSALVSLCNESPGPVFVVIDALDECEESSNREPVLELLRDLMDSQARLLITSRPFPPDIDDLLGHCSQILVEASASDIRAFVLEQITKSARMRKVIDNKLRDQIVSKIEQTSGGMFLLPALQISNVLSQTTRKQVVVALETLPTKLGEALDLTMERIRTQSLDSDSRAKLALNVLMWLSTVRRPITPTELQHAIAISEQLSEELSASSIVDLTDPVFFVDCCFGLVTIDSEKSVIRLVHFSVNEYLETRRDSLFPAADSILSRSCIAYLQIFSEMNDNPDLGADTWDNILDVAPFMEYSFEEWGHHAARGFDDDVDQAVGRFLDSKADTRVLTLLTEARLKSHKARRHEVWGFQFDTVSLGRDQEDWESAAACIMKCISKLHVAAIYGIMPLAQKCLAEQGYQTGNNGHNGAAFTPLMAAASRGTLPVLDLLLQHSSDDELNAADEDGSTALVYAVKWSRLDVVSKLLDSGRQVDVNLGSPLFWALKPYHTEERVMISTLLLDQPGLDPQQGPRTEDPYWLNLAEDWRHKKLEELLKHPKFDPQWWHSPAKSIQQFIDFVIATDYYDEFDPKYQRGAFAVVLLLDSDKRFPTPARMAPKLLWPAIYYAFTDVIPERDKLDWMGIFDTSGEVRREFKVFFTELGLTFNFTDRNGEGFLDYLAMDGPEEHLEHFLEIADANANRRNNKGQTALFQTCESGSRRKTVALLRSGADACVQDVRGWTPLHGAAKKHSESVAELLLQHGAIINTRTKEGETPLHVASEYEPSETANIIPALLRHGADIGALDNFDSTALETAVTCGNELNCKELLAARSPLSCSQWRVHLLSEAVFHMYPNICKILLPHFPEATQNPPLTGYGTTILDELSKYPEDVVNAMGFEHPSKMPQYKPSPASLRRQRLLKALLARLETVIQGLGGASDCLIWRMSRQLIELNEDTAAQVINERGVDDGSRGFTATFKTSGHYCHNCYTDTPADGHLLQCKTCAFVMLCEKCRLDRGWVREGWKDKVPHCQGHELLRYPRDVWHTLLPGVVNKEGQSFKEFLVGLKERYEAEYLGTLSIEAP
ncbi:hypothetical protein B0T16DRAFT_461843 [Cercophora newfieldiana]|uniref:NACHT domain-containing protein n=1 Tax=Cercophora newfieldiana TaxID=92897 RepID=A0AA39XXC6_9PEZI|nr:hypothetical protein B0T16DRAFT_461843 [Cercophora newfieldiana]